MPYLRLTSRARRDLKRLDVRDARRIARALESLRGGARQELDVKALQGRQPWLRMRIGPYRVIYRPLGAHELAVVSTVERRGETSGYIVERIVHRRDLDQAVDSLR